MQEALRYKEEWQAAQRGRLSSGADADSFVYVHLRADDGQPFYVGIGFKHSRPWERNREHNRWHKNIVAKHGVRVEIIADELTWEQACFWEIRWIKALKIAGYPLVNLTEGGDGTLGVAHTEKYRAELRKRMTLNNPMKNSDIAKKYSGERHHAKSQTHKNNFKVIMSGMRDIIVERMLTNNPMCNPEVAERVAQKNRGRKFSPESIEASASKRRGVPKTEAQKRASGAGLKRMWDSLSEEERKVRGAKRKLAHDATSPAERSAVANKGWETRRRNQLLKKGVE